MNLSQHIDDFHQVINFTVITNEKQQKEVLEAGLINILQQIQQCKTKQGMVYVIGNGGSAAIASHAVIDLANMAKVRALTLHDISTVTCLSNDYGYEHVYARQVQQLITKQDILIAISSSGKSANILNAVRAAKENGAAVLTLSGFAAGNPLRQAGDINIWLDASDYGLVEIGHAFILHHITDRLHLMNKTTTSLLEEAC